jgi:broad-specificity NMP kinase
MAKDVTTRIGPDLKIARRVMALLDEHFDETLRLYRGGWSDQKIADSATVSAEAVKTIRREAYGELSEDQEVTDLREEIELLKIWAEDETKKLFAESMIRIDALEAKLAMMTQVKRAG